MAKPSINTEPVALPGAIVTLSTAVLALLVGMDVIDAAMSPLILGVVAAVLGVVTSWQRSKVTPVANLQPPTNDGE